MTAIICSVSRDSATIFTDGAGYDDTGRLVLAHQKADILLHLPAIVASRGSGFAGLYLKAECSLRSSFDDLCDRMGEMLVSCSQKVADELGDAINLSAVYAGFSEREQAFLGFQMFIRGDTIDDLVPGSLDLNPIRPIYVEPWPEVDLMARRGLLNADGLLDLRTQDQVLAFMNCQREQPFRLGPRSGDKEGCIVGAFIQRTSLTRDGASTEIVHRWNDQIGHALRSAG